MAIFVKMDSGIFSLLTDLCPVLKWVLMHDIRGIQERIPLGPYPIIHGLSDLLIATKNTSPYL